MSFSSFLLSEITIYNKYAKFSSSSNTRQKESWEQIVTRTKNMHLLKFQQYPDIVSDIHRAFEFVYSKSVMPSMRSLQFAGLAIDVNPSRLYNCAYIPLCDTKAFSETMFLLLSGCGVGFSVQHHHVQQLPCVKKANTEKTKRFLIQDSIEGWSDAVKALMKSHFFGTAQILFDYRAIRPKGSMLHTAGGLAPGHEGLQNALVRINHIFERKVPETALTSLEVHDMICHIASAVLSGGIRRSALISLFTPEDHDMFTCKTGNFYESNPQRCYCNNSAVFLRTEMSKEYFLSCWERIMAIGTGEPGIYLTNDRDIGVNPCCELSLTPYQFCNLTEIDAAHIHTDDMFYDRCIAAAFISTLQASYTDFHYLRSNWKKNTERDALIGVSLTGLASCNVTPDMLTKGALLIKKENERVAKQIGIRKAARCTTLKPSGTTSIVMNTSSGICAWYDHYFIRRIRLNIDSPVHTDLVSVAPFLFERDVICVHDTVILSLPLQSSDDHAIIRSEETALMFLKRLKTTFDCWIKPGYTKGTNMNNISATCTVKRSEQRDVIEWLYENRDSYNGITVFPYDESSIPYQQLPFESLTADQFKERYDQLVHVQTPILNVLKSWASSVRVEETDGIAASEMNLSLEPSCTSSTSCEL